MANKAIIAHTEDDRKRAVAAVEKALLPFSILIQPPRKKYRRSQQNLLFATIQFIFFKAGNSGREEWELFREMMLRRHMGAIVKDIILPGGAVEKVKKRRTTTDLDKDGMTELIERIVNDAAVNGGIIVPSEEELHQEAKSSPFYDL